MITESSERPLATPRRLPPRVVRPFQWFFNPYVQLFAGGLINAAGELLLKKGAIVASQIPTTGALHFMATVFHSPPLGSIWTWLGIICYVTCLLCWLYVLKTIPLSIAFPVINGLHMLVPIGARFLLHEDVSLKRWIGISLALAGVLLILRPVATAEEKL